MDIEEPSEQVISPMAQNLLFERIETRVALDKEDGDHAYFHALSLKFEYVAKIVTAGIVACAGEDVDRQRYSLEHRLVRADSLGTWMEILHAALVGPPSRLYSGRSLDLVRDLTERVSPGDWRYEAVSNLALAASEIGVKAQLANRVTLILSQKVCAGRSRINVPTPGYNIQSSQSSAAAPQSGTSHFGSGGPSVSPVAGYRTHRRFQSAGL